MHIFKMEDLLVMFIFITAADTKVLGKMICFGFEQQAMPAFQKRSALHVVLSHWVGNFLSYPL